MADLKKKNSKLIHYILKTVPKYLYNNIKLNDNIITLHTNKDNLLFLINFLKYNWMLQYKTLIAITAIDYPTNDKRFQICYFFLSYKLHNRIMVTLDISENESIDSITNIYKGANWFEREIWDLFGVVFQGHPDLRRILTDYGFENFPFRKDFPQSGFNEIRYDDEKKHLVYEPLELTQEYRFFNYLNPWSNIK